MDRPRSDSRQHNGITVRDLSQQTFTTKSSESRLMHRSKFSGISPSMPDRLGQKRLSSMLKHPMFSVRIAIGSEHDDRNIRPNRLCLGKQFKSAHDVDVGQNQK